MARTKVNARNSLNESRKMRLFSNNGALYYSNRRRGGVKKLDVVLKSDDEDAHDVVASSAGFCDDSDDDTNDVVNLCGDDEDDEDVVSFRKKKKKRKKRRCKNKDLEKEEDGYLQSTKNVATNALSRLMSIISGTKKNEDDGQSPPQKKSRKKNVSRRSKQNQKPEETFESNIDNSVIVVLSNDDDDDDDDETYKNGQMTPPRKVKRRRKKRTESMMEEEGFYDLTQDASPPSLKLTESTNKLLKRNKLSWYCVTCGDKSGHPICVECQWRCGCSAMIPEDMAHCVICGIPRPSWLCQNCNTKNAKEVKSCGRCNQAHFNDSNKEEILKKDKEHKTKSSFDRDGDHDKVTVCIKAFVFTNPANTAQSKNSKGFLFMTLNRERKTIQIENKLSKDQCAEIQFHSIRGIAYKQEMIAFVIMSEQDESFENFYNAFHCRRQLYDNNDALYFIVQLKDIQELNKFRKGYRNVICPNEPLVRKQWKTFLWDASWDRCFEGQTCFSPPTWSSSFRRIPQRRSTKPYNDATYPLPEATSLRKIDEFLVQPRRSSRLKNRGCSIRSRRRNKPVKHLLSYPTIENAKDVVTLNTGDLERCDEGMFFNDNLIDFYTRYMREEKWPDDVNTKCHVFSCHFYEKLNEKGETFDSNLKINYENVRTWTKDINIFEKDYVIIPINGSSHWSLVIVHFKFAEIKRLSQANKNKKSVKQVDVDDEDDEDDDVMVLPTSSEKTLEILKGANNFILHMDSLKLHKSARIVKRLRTYFNLEWNRVNGLEKKDDEKMMEENTKTNVSETKKKITSSSETETEENEEMEKKRFTASNLPFNQELAKKVPQQHNGCDCGVYTLKFIECFVRDVLGDPTKCPSNLLTSRWFRDIDVSTLRTNIRKMLIEMHDVEITKKRSLEEVNGGKKEEEDDEDDGFEIVTTPSPKKKNGRDKKRKREEKEERKTENETPQGGFVIEEFDKMPVAIQMQEDEKKRDDDDDDGGGGDIASPGDDPVSFQTQGSKYFEKSTKDLEHERTASVVDMTQEEDDDLTQEENDVQNI